MFVVLLGGVAMAVDHSRWMSRQSEMQGIVDAAALAGAKLLAYSEKSSNAEQAASAFLTSKNFASGAFSVTADSTTGIVRVDLAADGKVHFGSVIGVKSGKIPVAAEAVASRAARPCIIALDPAAPVGIDFSLAGSVTAIDCAIWSNSKSSTSFDLNGSGSASSSENCAVGGISGSGFSISPAARGGCRPAIDPLLAWSPPSTFTCDSTLPDKLNAGAVTLAPGVYCGGLKIAGNSQVTLMPGVYTIKDGPLTVTSSASMTGDGVTILLTGAGSSINFLGSSTVHLSAATTGPTAGLVIAGGREEPVVDSIAGGGAEMDIEGTVYLPTHNLSYGGHSETLIPASYSLLIAKTIKFHGGSTVVVRGDPAVSKVPAMTAVSPGNIHLIR